MPKWPHISTIWTIKDGKVTIKNEDLFRTQIRIAPDGDYNVTIKKKYRKRTLNQNAFYWGPFLDTEWQIFFNEGWHFPNKDSLHDWNKDTFLRDTLVNEQTGEVMKIIRSSTGLNTMEWEFELMEQIRIHFREYFNAELPYPEP